MSYASMGPFLALQPSSCVLESDVGRKLVEERQQCFKSIISCELILKAL